MARVCEKNRCPTGIATHDPKFKKKYKGAPEHVVLALGQLAEEVRHTLSAMGVRTLNDVLGRGDLMEIDPRYHTLVAERGLELRVLNVNRAYSPPDEHENLIDEGVNPLNARLATDASAAVATLEPFRGEYQIHSTDRAVLARLAGMIGERTHLERGEAIRAGRGHEFPRRAGLPPKTIELEFNGSAGQGFAAFLTEGIDVTLCGEANDAVAKSMSGGRVVIRPPVSAAYDAATNVIAGNCVLYGATGGEVFISGLAGDRFAVRNSGAHAVVEGAGLHACEYMTGGAVAILGTVSFNVGAGMTGGRLYLDKSQASMVNDSYVKAVEWRDEFLEEFRSLLERHALATQSKVAALLLDLSTDELAGRFMCYAPSTGQSALPADEPAASVRAQ